MPSSHADNLQTLIESSCITCHDEYTETRLDLTKLDQNFEDVDSFRMWTNIFDRISSGEMPPESEPRPD
ncbi:MAG: c-type cytochrome domain-containing protein, partial [Planctomycetota bacterium]